MTENSFYMKQLIEDVEKFHAFLLEHDIDVFTQEVSFEFLRVMIPFSDIAGTSDYLRGVYHLLKHKAKYDNVIMLKKEE